MAALRTVLLSALVVTTSAQTAMWSIDSGSAFFPNRSSSRT